MCNKLAVRIQRDDVTRKEILTEHGKVKCTVVQALRLCTGCTVRRGNRGIGKGKVHRCTGTEALYRLYGP